MGRYRFLAYATAATPRYIVLWDLHWRIIDCQRIEPRSDLSLAMSAFLQQLVTQGWAPEGDILYGFVFVRRNDERRLLMLTHRDPFDTSLQSFDPFKGR